MAKRTWLKRAALAAGIVLTLTAQGYPWKDENYESQNISYDGHWEMARIRFTPANGGGRGWRRDIKWDHDYPRSDTHFPRLLSAVSTIRPQMQSNIFTLDNPELMKFPIAYLCEPGFWTMDDKELAGLRTYLTKGGFIIFDDFAGEYWYNFDMQIHRAFPQARFIELDASHPIFNSFFHIASLDFRHPYFGVQAHFFGLFEDNDPNKRMMAIINYNNDVSEYWEWSDEDFAPKALTNEAYKLGVNYVMYAMTH